MSRKYTRRGDNVPNAFKAYTVDEIVRVCLFRLDKQPVSTIAREIGRSTVAVRNLISFLKRMKEQSKNPNEMFNNSRLSKKSIEALKEAYKKISDSTIRVTSINNVGVKTVGVDLDTAIKNLDFAFSNLQEKVMKLVDVAVEEKSKDFVKSYQEEKEREVKTLKAQIKDLEQVAEIAKQSNLLDVLRKKFRGA